jgi:hypothetical protein
VLKNDDIENYTLNHLKTIVIMVNKNYIDNQFNQYQNITSISTLIDNYYDKDYVDLTLGIVYSNINLKFNTSDIVNYYNKTQIDTTFTDYYNKTYINNKFNEYYNITGVNSLLTNKVDSNTLNNYYDKSYINTSLSNFYLKYQVDGLLNNYYNYTTNNNLYASKNDFNNLAITVNSNLNEIVNIKNTLPSFLQTNSFNNTISSYLKINDFTSCSLVNTTQLNSLSITTSSTITYINNIYNNVNSNTASITDTSTTLNSVITDVSNIKMTLPSLLSIANFNNTINSYLLTNDFNNTIGSYLNTSNFNNTINSYLPTSTYNNTILTRLNSDFTNISNLQTSINNINNTLPSYLQTNNFNNTINSYLLTNNFNNTIGSYLLQSNFNNTIGSYLPTSTYNNTILTRLNTDFTNISNLQTSVNNINNTLPSYLQTNNFNNTVSSYLLTNNFNNTIGSYLTTSNFNNTIGSFLTTSNFNNTIGSYLTTSNFNNTIGSYLPTSTYNNTILTRLNTDFTNISNLQTSVNNINNTLPSYLQTNNFNNTIGSYLTTSNFNTTIGSFLRTANFNTTINSYLTTNAFNNTLTSQLSLKGNITNPSFFNNVGINTSSADSALHIVGARNVNPQSSTGIRLGNTSSAFSDATDSYGIELCSDADIRGGSTIDFTYPFSSGSYYAGRIFFENNSAYFGFNANYVPATSEIITSPYQMTLDRLGTLTVQNNIITDTITANSNFYATTCNTNFVNLSSGELYNYNYTLYSSLVLSHPYGMQFAITDSVPPLITTNSNILLTMDSFGGVDVNAYLTCETSMSVLGQTNLGGPIVSNITGNKSLYVSGPSTLRGNLTVSGTTNLNNTNINNIFTISGATTFNSTLNVIDDIFSSDIVNANNITTKTLFIMGSSNSYINSNVALNLNGGTNGVNIYSGANMISSLNTAGISLLYNSQVLRSSGGGDSSFKISNTLSGTSSLYLSTNITNNSSIYQDAVGNVNVQLNISNTSVLPVRIYPNGVVNVNASNVINNKQLVLYENAAGDAPSSAVNFSGIGLQSGGSLRYQTPTATHFHRFFCGTTQSFFITNGSGASGSDVRFKSDIKNIDNALDKINNIQGKSFLFQQNPNRQLGFIAQELLNIIPEVIIKDEDSEEKYLYLQYDRITALHNEGIKQLHNEIQQLKSRITALENK